MDILDLKEVWIVEGHYDYEGHEVLAVCDTEALAKMIRSEFIARAKQGGRNFDQIRVHNYTFYSETSLILGLQTKPTE